MLREVHRTGGRFLNPPLYKVQKQTIFVGKNETVCTSRKANRSITLRGERPARDRHKARRGEFKKGGRDVSLCS